MCNFGRGQYLMHTFEITLNLDQWFCKKCRLKIVFFFYFKLWWPFYLA